MRDEDHDMHAGDRPASPGRDHPRARAEETAAAAARGRNAPDKRPLHREVPPPAPFPVDALGPLRGAVEGLQAQTQAPAALCAQSALGAATLAVSPHADVVLPTGQARPLVEYFGRVAVSGERKTGTDDRALAEAHRVEEEWRTAYTDEQAGHEHDRTAWREACAAAKKEAREDGRAAVREALAEVGPEPRAPALPMLFPTDTTPDGLVLHLAGGRPWAGIFASEGGLFIGGHAMNDENRMRMAAILNAAWDGQPIRRQRVGTGFAFLPGRRLTAHVMAQPAVAARLLGDPMLDDIGLLARCLTVEPESTIGGRLFRAPPAWARAALHDHDCRLGHLLRRPPVTRPGEDRVLDPRRLSLSEAARRVWVAFHDAVERDLGEGGALRPVRAFGAKLAEHAGRLAGVLTVYGDPDAGEITGEAMACGIALAQHYAAEALRLQGAAAVAPELALAARLLAWWQGRGGAPLHLAEVYQRGLNALGSAAKARACMEVLVEHGHAQRLPPGTVLDGKPRREAWALVP